MPRCFVFLIGGTGPRIFQSFLYLLAAGCRNDILKKWEIVPVFIDLDTKNGNLKSCIDLLKTYTTLYGNLLSEKHQNQFWGTKISSLAEISRNAQSGDFVMELGLSNKSLRQVIDFGELENVKSDGAAKNLKPTQDLISLLYSRDELSMTLEKGFKGHPGIGTLVFEALAGDSNEGSFANEDFNAFVENFDESRGDRIFIVNSIFGGTGASGLPWLLKILRKNNEKNAGLQKAKTGVLSVMPYFRVQADKQGLIDSAGFISRTKAALKFYHQNLKPNIFFYIGEENLNTEYENQEGGIQQNNHAHPVELFGATSIIKFLEFDQKNIPDPENPLQFSYGIELEEDQRKINLTNFSPGSFSYQSLVPKLTQFYLASILVLKILKLDHSNRWALSTGIYEKVGNQISKSFHNSPFYANLESFMSSYMNWLGELKGANAFQAAYHTFEPFNLNPNAGIGRVDNKADLMNEIVHGINIGGANNDITHTQKRGGILTYFIKNASGIKFHALLNHMNGQLVNQVVAIPHENKQTKKNLAFTELLYRSTDAFMKEYKLFTNP